jgi:hypothetical protein
MPEDARSKADQYRREAEQLRDAAKVVLDEALREQLLSIAEQYEAMARRIESQPAAGLR